MQEVERTYDKPIALRSTGGSPLFSLALSNASMKTWTKEAIMATEKMS